MSDPIVEEQNETLNTIEDKSPTSPDSAQDTISIEALQADIVKLREEVQANLDGWQRSRAEFSNYKRRTSQELAEARERGALDALAKVLPVIDDFERAMNNIPGELREHSWISGTHLILKNMYKFLEEHNVTLIDPVGEAFDPTCHEAIGTDESSDYESGTVCITLQKGYRSGDRVLRPALVRVAS